MWRILSLTFLLCMWRSPRPFLESNHGSCTSCAEGRQLPASDQASRHTTEVDRRLVDPRGGLARLLSKTCLLLHDLLVFHASKAADSNVGSWVCRQPRNVVLTEIFDEALELQNSGGLLSGCTRCRFQWQTVTFFEVEVLY